jgi:Na+/proline symporter
MPVGVGRGAALAEMLIAILAYVVIQLLIGAYIGRRVRSESDYLLGGRSLGYTLATFSIFATWFGAETCIGSAGAIYEEGLSAASRDPFGYAACLLLMGLFFARRLWSAGLTTLGDLFRKRYSPGVERLAALLLIPTSVLWAAAQVRAFGLVLETTSGIDTLLATSIAAGVVIVYTAMGGLLADALTDLVQGGVLVIGILIAGVAVTFSLGGPVGVWNAVDTDQLKLAPDGVGFWGVLEMWAVPICGSVVAQELVSRVLGSRSPVVARRSAFLATGLYLTVGVIPLMIGLVGPKLVPALADSEHVLTAVVHHYLGPVAYVVFAGALVSAILSTVDSCLLAAGGLASENLIASLRPGLGSIARLRMTRACVVGFGVVAYVLALNGGSVYDLVEQASAFGSAGIFIVVCLGLFTTFGGAAAAYAGLIAGAGVWLVGTFVVEIPVAYVASLAAAGMAYASVALAERLAAARQIPLPVAARRARARRRRAPKSSLPAASAAGALGSDARA